MAGRSMFVMGFVQDPFQARFRLAQSGFESLPPEKKAELIESQLDETFKLHGKVMDKVNGYGGLGDRLRALLGPDYDNFVIAFYGQSGLGNKALKLYEAVSNPEAAARLDAADERAVAQWKKAVMAMNDILEKHVPIEATPSEFPTKTVLAVGGGLAVVAFLALG